MNGLRKHYQQDLTRHKQSHGQIPGNASILLQLVELQPQAIG